MSEAVDPMALLAKWREESPELEGIDAEAAARADREAEAAARSADMDRAMTQHDYVTGSGVPPLEIVKGLQGTAYGDEHASSWGLEVGDFSVEQFTTMHKNGMSWADISKRATDRRNRMR